MTSLMGGFVMEHVMRWDAAPDGRPYTTTDRAQISWSARRVR